MECMRVGVSESVDGGWRIMEKVFLFFFEYVRIDQLVREYWGIWSGSSADAC